MVRTLYSKRQNASCLYTLRKQIHEFKQGVMDATSFFDKLSLIWQEMDLCKELVWRDLTDGLQYSRIEEVNRIYDFLAGLNPKFDVVRGRILGQRPIPSLMEVCSEISLEKDRTSDMNISTTPSINSAAFSARSSTSGNYKH
ncbi:hypothetical protein IC582_004472 [Cucumis melo]